MRKLIQYLMARDGSRSPRNAAPAIVSYYWDGDTAIPVAKNVRNISPTGLYLLTERRWYPGTLLTLTLQKSSVSRSDSEETIAVLARVVRIGEDGVGFSFVFAEGDRENEKLVGDRRALASKRRLKQFLSKLD